MKYISLFKRKIPYRFKKDRRTKGVKLTVYSDGSLLVSSPFRVNSKIIEKLILEKSSWIIKKLDSFDNSLKLKGTKEDFLKNKGKALELVKKKISKFNKTYNFEFEKIKIKNQKTRWGSCSKKKNLNFNYKIIFLKERLAEYIIVHELCHLKELNHSLNFWQLVSRTIPGYKQLKKELRVGLDIYD